MNDADFRAAVEAKGIVALDVLFDQVKKILKKMPPEDVRTLDLYIRACVASGGNLVI